MKKLNRWVSLLLVSMTFLVLAGCSKSQGDDSEISSDNEYSYEQSEQGSDTSSEIGEDDNLYVSGEDELEQISIYSGEKFSEGLAWVLYYYGDEVDNRRLGLLKESGEIITLDLPVDVDKYVSGSDFYGGYSYINYTQGDQEGFIIIDSNGKCVLQNQTDAGYTVMCGGEEWFLVKKSIRSMENSEDLFGIINVKGEWVYKPQSEFMYGPEQGGQWMLDVGAKYFYLGNGIFRAQWYPGNMGRNIPLNVVLDAKTGEYAPVELPLDDNYESKVEGTYNNNVIWSYSSSYGGSVNRLNWDGASTELVSLKNYDWVDVKLCDGSIYVADGEQAVFIDADGNVLIDLSQYSINAKNTICEFSDGYAAVIINGEDGYEYLEIIDTNGKCSFEPKKLDKSFYFIDGKMACILHDEPDKVSWVDANGNVQNSTIDKHDMDNLSFSDGYAFYSEKNCYISNLGDKLNVTIQ